MGFSTHTTKKNFRKKKLPTKMMHMAGTHNVSAYQNGKNQNPPIGPFWENWYFVSIVVRILPKICDLSSKICTKH